VELIQGNFGHKGNFEVVVREGEKLRHYWRNNDVSGLPWNRRAIFGDKADSAPALIQSNCGHKGNFEVVVREGEKLRHYWRNNDSGLSWNKRAIFPGQQTGPTFCLGTVLLSIMVISGAIIARMKLK